MLKIETLFNREGQPDTLYINWLEYQPFMKLDMEENLFGIIDQVRSMGIKNLIFDPSCRQTDPSDEHLIAFFELFLSGLAQTNLEKFARVSISDDEREARFRKYINDIKENLKVRFELRHFANPAEAHKWLGLEVCTSVHLGD